MTQLPRPHLPILQAFARAHPHAVVCALYHRPWRDREKLTHVYYRVTGGAPRPIAAHLSSGFAALPHYTLDVERNLAWRYFTGDDLRTRFERRFSTHHLTDAQYRDFCFACRQAAIALNRYFKTQRLAAWHAATTSSMPLIPSPQGA